jgi:hypothetical protein
VPGWTRGALPFPPNAVKDTVSGEHLSMPYDHIADRDVLNALDPAHQVAPACTPVLPVLGG